MLGTRESLGVPLPEWVTPRGGVPVPLLVAVMGLLVPPGGRAYRLRGADWAFS